MVRGRLRIELGQDRRPAAIIGHRAPRQPAARHQVGEVGEPAQAVRPRPAPLSGGELQQAARRTDQPEPVEAAERHREPAAALPDLLGQGVGAIGDREVLRALEEALEQAHGDQRVARPPMLATADPEIARRRCPYRLAATPQHGSGDHAEKAVDPAVTVGADQRWQLWVVPGIVEIDILEVLGQRIPVGCIGRRATCSKKRGDARDVLPGARQDLHHGPPSYNR
jgi:hypothetical protein